ncbi:MAG: T9SS type A sorting domain-containing protein [Flavobacteriales bacterium]|nr:T9SS type A sorting domain-containing protein [Flavobacteriales bacterium]
MFQRLLFLLPFLLTALGGWAQPIYFDKLFDYDHQTEILLNAVSNEGNLVFVARSRDVYADTAVLYFVRMDQEGNELLTNVFNPRARSMRAGTLITHPDSGYVFFNSIEDTSGVGQNLQLIRFNDIGEAIWTVEYPRDGDDFGIAGIQCADGGYAMYAQAADTSGNSANNMFIRTDSSGTEQWRKFYGGGNWEAAYDLLELPNGDFFLLGWTRSYGHGQRDFYLVKTDPQGDEIWHKTYGTSNMETGTDIIRLSDGNYLLAGAQIIDGVDKGKLIKVNGSGTIIWQEEYLYPGSDATEINQILELEEGSFVGTGVTDNSGEGNAGWLLKTDSEGNLLWQRKYNHNQYTDLFYGVLATDDGGFLLSGQAINLDNNSQDAWLLKVDSIGCPYPNCTVGIEEEEKIVMVDVWPNPVNDVLNIEKADFSASLEMTVFDVNGRLMTSSSPSFSESERLRIDVSSWPSGLYILQGCDEKGRSFSVKVIKE